MRLLDEKEVNYITMGASVLSCGGGGDPYIGKVMALNAIKKYGSVKLLSVDELESGGLIVASGFIGAPTVMIEKIPNGNESIQAYKFIEKSLNKKISAIFPIEVGGINTLLPLVTAAHFGIPLVDLDTMGRAFPEYQMTTLSLDNINASPFVIVDAKLNTGLVRSTNNYSTEKLVRALCTEMGSVAFLAAYPITPDDAKKSGILGTLSFAQRIGEKLEQAHKAKTNIVQALLTMLQGFVLFHGKITKVEQRISGGFTCGVADFIGIDRDKGKMFKVSFQNEYLLAQCIGCFLCTTPDLIILLDEETGMPILTERLRYGMRVVALGVPANKKWRTPRGIEVAGPRYFNYDVDFIPVETLATTN